MPQDQHTIYVSYADADEDWVTHLINDLKVYLCKQLGEIDDNFIWARYMLRGTDNKRTVPQQHLKNSKYLLVILSNAYLNSDAKKEIDSFKAKENLIVVEHDKVTRPNSLEALQGYQFWDSDERGRVVRLGTAAAPDNTKHKYYQQLNQMARDIAEKLSVIQEDDKTPPPSKENEETTIFLAKTNKYKQERDNLRIYLEKQGFLVLPQAHYDNSDCCQLMKDIKKSSFFIQLFETECISQIQCDIAKKEGLPILRWAEKQHELNSDCPTPICTDVAAFKLEICHWIAGHKDNPKMIVSSNTQSSPTYIHLCYRRR